MAWESGRRIGGLGVAHRGYCDGKHAEAAPCNTSRLPRYGARVHSDYIGPPKGRS